MRVLLHACCGPCALYPLATLRSEGIEVTGFFYNHNIHPYQEFARRRDTAQQMAALEGMPLIVRDEYRLEEFLANVAAAPDERCGYCYASRLDAVAAAALDGGFDAFTSSLFYSRYQNHDLMRQKAEDASQKHGILFLYRDFRPGWQEGIRRSKQLELYRQQYCGCIYSEKERY
ncbi:MAG: epoxyqueuosine reductase QueH, partial [Trichlorobacter sp.]|uniref:epoxyqueuosine reductase QueH n=1 Tax=Trichlorobacter sp. TaxID=2911007 RepID=UPI00256759BC